MPAQRYAVTLLVPRHVRRQQPRVPVKPKATVPNDATTTVPSNGARPQEQGVVAALPTAVVVLVERPDVLRSRVAVVGQVEGDGVERVGRPGFGLGDAHELLEHGIAGGVGEKIRGRVPAEGHLADVDAHIALGEGEVYWVLRMAPLAVALEG